MIGVEVHEVSLEDEYRLALTHDTVKKHFAAAIEYFDEEFGPGISLAKPELVAAFVTAAATESLAAALSTAKFEHASSAH